MKVALVYDRVNKFGGAEKVLLALHEIFPDAPLYTSVYNESTASWARVFQVKTSFLQKIPFAKTSHEYFATFMPLVFESFDFSEFDLVISITSEAAKGIVTIPKTKHVCICLTPTRYLWSGYEEYFKNTFLKLISKPIIGYLRAWDKVSASRPDRIIAISEVVQKRIKRYYNLESDVVYPPVSVNGDIKKSKTEDFYLVVSRLVRYKRVDLAIEAANKMGLALVVIGDGRQKKRLEKIAGETVTLLGFVPDDVLYDYYSRCKALIFPGKEDFGISIVEAQMFGKPVIAYGKGGAKEIIINNKTGLLFERQSVQSLCDALKSFEKNRYNSDYCRKNANRFSKKTFETNIKNKIKETLTK